MYWEKSAAVPETQNFSQGILFIVEGDAVIIVWNAGCAPDRRAVADWLDGGLHSAVLQHRPVHAARSTLWCLTLCTESRYACQVTCRSSVPLSSQCRINANRGPWQLFARGWRADKKILYFRRPPWGLGCKEMPYFLIAAIKKKTNTKNPNPNMVVLASEIALVLVLYCTREFPWCDSLFKSQRIYFQDIYGPDINRPILFFVAEVMSNYLTTDGLKKNLYFRRPPWGLRPVAFATYATWLIRHCIQCLQTALPLLLQLQLASHRSEEGILFSLLQRRLS